MDLIESTLKDYAREGKVLYDRLFLNPFFQWNKDGCRQFTEMLARYEFIANMFKDMNLFHWRDDNFDISERNK